jgi:hypothetical protein
VCPWVPCLEFVSVHLSPLVPLGWWECAADHSREPTAPLLSGDTPSFPWRLPPLLAFLEVCAVTRSRGARKLRGGTAFIGTEHQAQPVPTTRTRAWIKPCAAASCDLHVSSPGRACVVIPGCSALSNLARRPLECRPLGSGAGRSRSPSW